MKRVPMTFLVLAGLGGCMAVEPDAIEDSPYARPGRSTVQSQPQSQSWSYLPQSAKAAVQNTNDKAENPIVKAAYTESKSDQPASSPNNLGMLRLTNSKRISFRHESSDATLTGAAGVEVWGTTDMRNWKKYEATSPSPSSLVVEVTDEGLYGFTMISRGKGESVKEQPPNGEPPQVLVAVDLTRPDVQLIDAELNATAQTPALIVRWNAKDNNFGSQPITVLYAERPEGPWLPLAANLENSGHYEGSPPPRLTDNVYVRVQAADLMGNVGQSQTTVLRTARRATIRSLVQHSEK